MRNRNLLLTGTMLAALLAGGLTFRNNSKKINEAAAVEDCTVYIGIDTTDKTAYVSNSIDPLYYYVGEFFQYDLSNGYDKSIFADIYSGNFVDSIECVQFLNEINSTNCSMLFKDLYNLTEIKNFNYLDTSSCFSMSEMFSGCEKLETLDLSCLDTAMVYDMREMFKDCAFTNLDLHTFNVDKVTEISGMFQNCSNLETLTLPDFSKANLYFMTYIFRGCSNLKEVDLSTFHLENLLNGEDALYGFEPLMIKTPAVLPVDEPSLDLYLPLYSEQERFFFDSDFVRYTKIGNGDGECGPNKTIYSDPLFYLAQEFASSFNVNTKFFLEDGKITSRENLFKYWRIAKDMFDYKIGQDYNDVALNILKNADENTPDEEIKKFAMTYDMIYGDYKYVLDTNGGDFLGRCPEAGKPDGLIHLGYDAFKEIGYISNVNTYEVLNANVYWVYDPSDLRIDSIFSTYSDDYNMNGIEKIVIQNEITITNPTNFFKGLSNLTEIDGLENLNVSNATNFTSMFEDCASLETIDLSALDLSNALIVDGIFRGCQELKSVDLSSINTNVSSMYEMFANCYSLIEVDLSRFDFEKVTNCVGLFKDASAIAVKTPKNVTGDIALPLGLALDGNVFYDLDFEEYTLLPKGKTSMLLVSVAVKRQIVKFCSDFNEECSLICDANGNSNIDKITKLWSDTAEYVDDHYENGSMPWIMEFLKQDNSSHKCAELKEFSEKYDYIYGKYYSLLENNGGDFAKRNISSSGLPLGTNYLFNYNNNENPVKAIVLVAVLSCSLLVLLVFISRRHKNH